METQIVKIGNSQGIRIPATLIRQHGLKGRVRLVTTSRGLLISPEKPRRNWSQAFRELAGSLSPQERELSDLRNKFDEEEWQW